MILKSIASIAAACLLAAPAFADAPRFKPGARGDAALVAAVKANDVATAKRLLDAGADANSTNAEGYAVLDDAISNQAYALIALLIEHGVDLNYDFMGTSPLFHARLMSGFETDGNAQGKTALAEMERRGAVYSDFDNAFLKLNQLKRARGWKSLEDGYTKVLQSGEPNILALFVQYFYDVNKPFSKARILPLHYAAIVGPATAVTYLIDHGADVNELTDKGLPPLWFARDRPEIQALLVQRGAKPFDPATAK